MTPTEALKAAGFEAPDNWCRCGHHGGDHDLWNRCLICDDDRFTSLTEDELWDRAFAALPPGWRLCGPDDVTVTVEGLAVALHGGDGTTTERLGRAIHEDEWCMQMPVFPASECDACQRHAAAILAALSADTTPSPSADRPREEER